MVSTGKHLHDLGLTQGTLLRAGLFDEEARARLCSSRLSPSDRTPTKLKHKIQDDDLLVVLSQECDIACNLDKADPLIELSLFKRIKENELHPGNQYAQSVRKLQLKIKGEWLQAQLNHICWIEKSELLQLVKDNRVERGDEELSLVLSTWRGNRYNRAALPDRFNETIRPFMAASLSKLDSYSDEIVSLYVKLNSYTEIDDYKFEIIALIVTESSDETFAIILTLMEELSYSIEENSGFEVGEDSIFAARQADISVEKISKYRRFNLDYLSLSDQPGNDFTRADQKISRSAPSNIKKWIRYFCIRGLRWTEK